MYGRCGRLGDARQVFDRMRERDQVSWNSMIAALCRFEEWELALEAFRSMMELGNPASLELTSFTFVGVALACSNIRKRDGLRLGKQVHGHSLRVGNANAFTNNALMAMYAKLGRVDVSKTIFELFGEGHDRVSWNTMISSFSQNGRFYEALAYLRLMSHEGIKPDGVTIASALPACSHLSFLDVGKEIHTYALRNDELIGNSFVGSALVDMYCNCREVGKARQVFNHVMHRELGLWNAMIAGYAQNEFDLDGLLLFIEMIEKEGLSPNATTMSCVLPSSVHCEAFLDREGIHGYAIKLGLEKDKYVQNALMDMYAKMEKMEISKRIFESMEDRDTVSWNTMITAHVIYGFYSDALNLLQEMQQIEEATSCYDDQNGMRCRPNAITLITVLPGCAAMVALEKGKQIHGYAIRHALASDVAVGSTLVDMYGKCGCLSLSRRVFNELPSRNLISWNALILAYGMHGKGVKALELFKNMVDDAVNPNEVTFIVLFAACSHSRMVNEGLMLFQKMKEDYGIEPTWDHYACIVDLLGRAGRLEEAYQLINNMPSDFEKVGAWSSLIGACQIHKNLELGEIAAQHLFQVEPNVSSHYISLSNIYSCAGLWSKAMEVRNNMKQNRVRKEPGCSWIEFGGKVHRFRAGDGSQPQRKHIISFLEMLMGRMRKEGYVPDTSCVLHNVDEGEKENLLCGHSEKLAIAFGILNKPPGTTIRVAKNLRVCNDCHIATKFMSKVLEREIIVRDVKRFHHFKNGACSCGDFW